MKTINEALDKAYENCGENAYFGSGFYAGVEFAQRWVSVEDELPEDSDNLTQTEKYIYTESPVLVRTTNGKYSVSKRSKFKENKNSKWEWIGSSSFSDSITHWRPIEFR